MLRITTILLFTLTLGACAQPPAPMTRTNPMDPLMCDPETGTCTIPGHAGTADHTASTEGTKTSAGPAAITVQYFTDPICSSCWGVEPQLRRLKLAYGDAVQIDLHMGGLLPGWDGYNGGGIASPADVAQHWDEASAHYRMPIIGDVWIEDPLSSSFPPSIAYKAAELQSTEKAELFMRRMREQVFTEKKNIATWRVQAEAAVDAGLDTVRLQQDISGAGKALFEADLTLARAMGVRGFPSMFFSNTAGERQLVYGARPYATFQETVAKLAPDLQAAALPTTLDELFDHYATWTAQEVAIVLDRSHEQAQTLLSQAEQEGTLIALHTRNGSIWHRR